MLRLLHNSIPIYSYTRQFFNGLLAELPMILNLFPNTTSDYIGVLVGVMESHILVGKNRRQVVTLPYGLILVL